MKAEEHQKQTEQIERIFEKTKHEVLAVIASMEPEIREVESEPQLEPLVTIKVAAQHLGISESQLRALEKQGLVPAYRPGGILRFDLAELREAVRSKKFNLRAVS
jgi:excisionase family DNA binding protein